MYVRGKQASDRLGISQTTLRKLAASGSVPHIVLPSGHRRYDVSSAAVSAVSIAKAPKARIVYARVSSAGQKDDLQRQIAMLLDAYPGREVVSDVGSGIDFGRKGLQSVLERAMRGEVEELVVAHRDRLARFAFDLLSWIFRKCGVEVVVHEPAMETPEQELVDDLLSVVTVFASRTYGRRKYKRRRANGERRPAEAGRERLAPDQDLPERR